MRSFIRNADIITFFSLTSRSYFLFVRGKADVLTMWRLNFLEASQIPWSIATRMSQLILENDENVTPRHKRRTSDLEIHFPVSNIVVRKKLNKWANAERRGVSVIQCQHLITKSSTPCHIPMISALVEHRHPEDQGPCSLLQVAGLFELQAAGPL